MVIITRHAEPEPRHQFSWMTSPPIFGVDVNQLQPGKMVTLDGSMLGYPVASLRELPAGDYYVQAVLNVYTEFHRADGHVIWAHEDHWEGQRFDRSPGNLYSKPIKVHIDPKAGFDVSLDLTRVIPPLSPPRDTKWLKHIKIQSPMLTKFWGRPVYLGATVLIPKGYDDHPDVHYPVVYMQAHFGQRPFFFNEDPASETKDAGLPPYGMQTGYDFYKSWISDSMPRFFVITLHHPTPYFDDSYAVDSANNGPYGDAIQQELLPYLEDHFRMIRKPYARLLEGGSTGGWEALALQLYHPEYYGGAWVFNPDPVDFRQYQLVNIYADTNAFISRVRSEWLTQERPAERLSDGQVTVTERQFSQVEAVIGSNGRSGLQLNAWEAVYGPVGTDGYPKPLWDKRTGTIDRSVANYMRDNGYDLRAYAERNWTRIGPHLHDKLHFISSEMDNYFLNLAVYRFEDFLKQTTSPHVDGSFIYGRPLKTHGWHPTTFTELLQEMAAYVKRHAPAGEDTTSWTSY